MNSRLRTEALDRLALIVRGADTARPDLAPEAAGLLAASLGLSRMYRDDLAQLEAGLALYDAFYRWCRDATDETHNWPHGDEARMTATRPGPCPQPSPRRLRVWLRIGLLSFGGPAAQIAADAQGSWWSSATGSRMRASCTRSISACCCPGPRRSSLPPISAG